MNALLTATPTRPHTPSPNSNPEPLVKLNSNLPRSQQQQKDFNYTLCWGEGLRGVGRPPHFSAFDKQHANVYNSVSQLHSFTFLSDCAAAFIKVTIQ